MMLKITDMKFMRYLICLLLAGLSTSPMVAQSYAFGAKGGLTVGMQKWNGFAGRDALIRYHGDLFIESATEENLSSLYAQLGYHVKGGALRTNRWYDPVTMQEFRPTTQSMEFGNLSLVLGAKQKFDIGGGSRAYYGFGARVDYNLMTNFGGFFQTYEGLENKFTWGVTVQVGSELYLGEFVSGFLEVSFSPDLSKQIYIPPQDTGYTDSSGRRIVLREQDIANIILEVSMGIRLLHKIEYID